MNAVTVVCLSLLLTAVSSAEQGANNTKWSTPVAERRSGGWVPLSAPCPTCVHSDASPQSSELVDTALPPQLFQQPSNIPLFPQQAFLQQSHQPTLSPAQQQFQLLMSQLLQQANGGAPQFIQHPLPQGLNAQGQNVFLPRQPTNSQFTSLPGNTQILQQSRQLPVQQIQNSSPLQVQSPTLNQVQDPRIPLQQTAIQQATVRSSVPPPPSPESSIESSEDEEDEEEIEGDEVDEGKEEVQLLYVPVETLRQRGRLPQQKQENTQYNSEEQTETPLRIQQNTFQQQQKQQPQFEQRNIQQQQQIVQQQQVAQIPTNQQQGEQQRHRFQSQRRQPQDQTRQQQQTQQYEQPRRQSQEQRRQQNDQQRLPQDQQRQQQYDQQQRAQYQEQRHQQVNKQRAPTTTTPNPVNQPPLAVYMDKLGHDVKLSDVINTLRETKTISVLDEFGPDSPQIFVGPSNLNAPEAYAKFEIPYLSALESNRVERKVDKLPFFVAPLSFQPPAGYSKIPFPAPHVGSVVVANVSTEKKDIHVKSNEGLVIKHTQGGQYSLPADLPPINPELPSLVNSLQDSRQPGNVLLVPASQQSVKPTQYPQSQEEQFQPGLRQPQTAQTPTLHQFSYSQQAQIPAHVLETSTVGSTAQPARSTPFPPQTAYQPVTPTQASIEEPQYETAQAPRNTAYQGASQNLPKQQTQFYNQGGFQETTGFVSQQGVQQTSKIAQEEFEAKPARVTSQQQYSQQQLPETHQTGIIQPQTHPQVFDNQQFAFAGPQSTYLAQRNQQAFEPIQAGFISQGAEHPNPAGQAHHQAGIQTLQAGIAIQQSGLDGQVEDQQTTTIALEPETTTSTVAITTPSRRGQYRGRQRGTPATYTTSTTPETSPPTSRRTHTRGRRPTHSRNRNEEISYSPANQLRTRPEPSTTPANVYQTVPAVVLNPNIPSDSFNQNQNQFQLQIQVPSLQQPVSTSNLDGQNIQRNQEDPILQNPPILLNNQEEAQYFQYTTTTTPSTTTAAVAPQIVQSPALSDSDSFQSQRSGSQNENGRRGSSSRNQRFRNRGGNARQRQSQPSTTTTTLPTVPKDETFNSYGDIETTSTYRSINQGIQQENFSPIISTQHPQIQTDTAGSLTLTQQSALNGAAYNQQLYREQGEALPTTTESAAIYQPQEHVNPYQTPQDAQLPLQVLPGSTVGQHAYQQDTLQQQYQHQSEQSLSSSAPLSSLQQQQFIPQYQEPTLSPALQNYHTTEDVSSVVVQQPLQDTFSESVEYSPTTEEATTPRQVPKYNTFQRTRGRTHAQKNSQSVNEESDEETSYLQQPGNFPSRTGGFRQSTAPQTRLTYQTQATPTAAEIETPKPVQVRLRGRVRARQRTNQQQQESENYPVFQSRDAPKPHDNNFQTDQQSSHQYQSVRNSAVRPSLQPQTTEVLPLTAPQSTEDYSHLSNIEVATQSGSFEDPADQSELVNTGISTLLTSQDESAYSPNPNTYSSTTAQEDHSYTTEAAAVHKTGGRKNFVGRGSARRTARPTAEPPSAAAATTTPGPNKVYTVRPNKRPQPQKPKITTVRGRIRRPTVPTSTTTEELPNYPTADSNWNRQQGVRFSPSAASNEVYDSGLDENIPLTRNGAQRTSQRGRGPTTARYQPAFISNIAELTTSRDRTTESNYYQFGALDEDESNASPQWTSQQGVALNFHHDKDQDTHEEYTAEETAESQWSSSRLQYTDSKTKSKTTEDIHSSKPDHERTNSEDTHSTLESLEGDEPEPAYTKNENTSVVEEFSVQPLVSAENNESQPALDNNTNEQINVPDQEYYNSTSDEDSAPMTTQIPITESSTTEKKAGHGRRRGGWVRVRAKGQPRDILETAESQNVATVTNIVPAAVVKESIPSPWVFFNPVENRPASFEDEQEDEYDNEADDQYEYPKQSNPDNSFITKQVFFTNYDDYPDEHNRSNTGSVETERDEIYSTPSTLQDFPESDLNVSSNLENLKQDDLSLEDLKQEQETNNTFNATDNLAVESSSSFIHTGLDDKSSEELIVREEDLDQHSVYNSSTNTTSNVHLEESNSLPSLNKSISEDLNNEESLLETILKGIEEIGELESSSPQNETANLDDEKNYTIRETLNETSVNLNSIDQPIENDVNNTEYTVLTTAEPPVETEVEPITEVPHNTSNSSPNSNEGYQPEETTNTTGINLHRLKEYQQNPMRFLGTSTSTEVSHETEICYRGRCVKTKTAVDQTPVE